MKHLFRSVSALFLLFVLTITAHAQADFVSLDETRCLFPVSVDQNIDCYTLTVPENPAEPDGRTVELPVVQIRARDGSTDHPPLLWTAGGPGSSSLGPVTFFRNSPLSDTRDVLLLEQRGAPFADPSLKCPEIDGVSVGVLFTQQTPQEEIARWRSNTRACYDRLQSEENVDLDQYNTMAVARDLEALRNALAIDTWHLFGVSYSTRLMLVYAQAYPDAVESLILDGVYPPDVTLIENLNPNYAAALERLYTACAEDAACSAAYEDLESALYAQVERLNADPALVVIENPLDTGTLALRVTGDDVLTGFFQALYNPSTVRWLPFIIHQLDQEQDSVLAPLGQASAEDLLGGEWGLFYSMMCADEAPFNSEAAIREATATTNLPEGWRELVTGNLVTVCEAWPVSPSDESTRALPTDLEAPVLLLSGGYDPITPRAYADRVAAALPNTTSLFFEPFGHLVYFDSACARDIVAAFANDPGTQLDTSCMDDLPPVDFVEPSDITATPAIFRLNRDVLGYNSLLQSVLLFIIVGALVANVTSFFVRLINPSTDDLVWALWLSTSIAVVNLGWMLLVFLALQSTSPLILGFGLPSRFVVLRIVPWITGLMSIGLLLGLAYAYYREDRSLTSMALSLAAGVAGTVLFIYAFLLGFTLP